MAAIERSEILRRLRENIEKGIPIIGTGAGTGISAKFEEAGGTDLIIIYNSGRYRMAGRGSCAGVLAYGDANAIVMEMANEVLPVVKNTPVLAGVNGTDPFKDMHLFLKQVKERGFKRVGRSTPERFAAAKGSDITVTVRRTLGADINAACGQLRLEHADNIE